MCIKIIFLSYFETCSIQFNPVTNFSRLIFIKLGSTNGFVRIYQVKSEPALVTYFIFQHQIMSDVQYNQLESESCLKNICSSYHETSAISKPKIQYFIHFQTITTGLNLCFMLSVHLLPIDSTRQD